MLPTVQLQPNKDAAQTNTAIAATVARTTWPNDVVIASGQRLDVEVVLVG